MMICFVNLQEVFNLPEIWQQEMRFYRAGLIDHWLAPFPKTNIDWRTCLSEWTLLGCTESNKGGLRPLLNRL